MRRFGVRDNNLNAKITLVETEEHVGSFKMESITTTTKYFILKQVSVG
jgi:hypothetical protein